MYKIMTARKCIETLNERNASVFLILLLCGDLVFIVMHCINALTPILGNPLLNIEEDKGYPEVYQYLKFFSIIVLLIYISLKNKAIHYVAWALVFTYFLFDDSLQIHERIGSRIAANFNFIPPLGLRLQDFGELVVMATVGIPLLAICVWAYKRSGSQMFRKVSQDITLLVLVLVFFGVLVDMAHIAVNLGWKVTFILGVIEDGGEMLSVSLVLWYAFLTKRGDNAGCYLSDLVRIVLTRRCTRPPPV
jgi:hypothetical protein